MRYSLAPAVAMANPLLHEFTFVSGNFLKAGAATSGGQSGNVGRCYPEPSGESELASERHEANERSAGRPVPQQPRMKSRPPQRPSVASQRAPVASRDGPRVDPRLLRGLQKYREGTRRRCIPSGVGSEDFDEIVARVAVNDSRAARTKYHVLEAAVYIDVVTYVSLGGEIVGGLPP